MKNQKLEGKMCPYDTKNKNGQWVCDILNLDGSPKGRCPAPDNIPKGDLTTPCQIPTPKKKVKKLFNMGTGDEYIQVNAWAHPDIFTTENPLAWVARNKSPVCSMRVTITGERKDIRGKK